VAHRRENPVLRIDRQTRRRAALFTQVELLDYFEGLGIDHRDTMLVRQVKIKTSLAVCRRLIDGGVRTTRLPQAT
jgi:hypothetical protein